MQLLMTRMALVASLLAFSRAHAGDVAILVYHRFGSVVHDTTTIRTSVFARQVIALRASGYKLVPPDVALHELDKGSAAPSGQVAITVDDGHRSVFQELFPLIVRERIPVTLFIYPSCIGRASYALSWEQLQTMVASGLVTVESHTWWHPDFHAERKRLPAADYTRLVRLQLERPRVILRERLGVEADILAWPYGIHDAELEKAATAAGYRAALALGDRVATPADPVLALPRILATDSRGVGGLLTAIRPARQP